MTNAELLAKIKAEIERLKADYKLELVEVPDKYKTPAWLFKEEPVCEEPDLDEETIRIEFRTIADKCFNEGIEGWEREKLIARHFYKLGLNARKEEIK